MYLSLWLDVPFLWGETGCSEMTTSSGEKGTPIAALTLSLIALEANLVAVLVDSVGKSRSCSDVVEVSTLGKGDRVIFSPFFPSL